MSPSSEPGQSRRRAAGAWVAAVLASVTSLGGGCAATEPRFTALAPASERPEEAPPPPPDFSGDPREVRRRALEEEARRPKVAVRGAYDDGLTEDALERRVDEAPADGAARFALARRLHLRGVDGDDDAAARAESLLEALAAERPQDPRVTAFLGSARLLAARRTWAFWRKGELVEQGLALLDRAVSATAAGGPGGGAEADAGAGADGVAGAGGVVDARASPAALEVRFVRAISCYALPFFFNRGAQAASDFAAIARDAEAAVHAGLLDPALAAAALFYDGVILADAGDLEAARERWRRAARVAPEAPHARAAAARIAGAS